MEADECAVRCPLSEKVTDAYLITMLLVFPLFYGFSGYREITLSKYLFFLIATGLFAAALALCLLRERRRIRLGAAQYAALAYLLACLLSYLCSPYRAEALLGAGRYDGLLTSAGYVAAFLGVSLAGRPKNLHAVCAAVAVGLCAVIGILQLAELDILRLFPEGLGYYDAGLRYSGAFLGTIGNMNILDAVLCLAAPTLFGLYVCGHGRGYLLSALLCIPVVQKAGGDGALLSLGLGMLLGMPLLLTDCTRVDRAAGGGCLAAWTVYFTMLWQPGAGKPWVYTAPRGGTVILCALVLFTAAAILYSLYKTADFSPRALRRFFCALSVLLLLGGIGYVFLAKAPSGLIYELRQCLLGQAEDSFGSSRLLIWRRCLALAGERPLLGGGPDTLALRLGLEFSRYVPETGETLRSFVDNAHNLYLGALVNAGVLGLLTLLATGVLALARGWRRRAEPGIAPLLLGAVCCAIHEFFGLGLVLSTPLLWIALALLCAAEPAREVSL